MNSVDKKFIENFNEIKSYGISNRGEEVRPRWSDGEPAYTKSVFAQINRYDLSRGLPVLSIRKTGWKTAIKEILWIWRDRSNDINDLDAHIWDDWADETGSIGKAYGYQLGRVINFPDTPVPMNQVDRIIYLLRHDRNNRRMVTNLFNHDDLGEMGLHPCAFMTMWKVTGNKLNMTLTQRSGDFLSASGCGGFNVVQYAVLVHMIAKITGLEVGELVHVVNDSHIYDRHEEILDELISKHQKTYSQEHGSTGDVTVFTSKDEPLPKLKIKGKHLELRDFRIEDFELEGYEPYESIGRFEVAV